MTGGYTHHYTNRAMFDHGHFIIGCDDRLAAIGDSDVYISDCKNRKCFFQIWQPVRANLSGRHNNKKVRKKTKLHIAARGNMSNSCGSESP